MLNRAPGKSHFVSASLFCGVGTGVDGKMDTGYSILDIGYSILDIGYSILDIGYWILDTGNYINIRT
jgi:hypothetical protein